MSFPPSWQRVPITAQYLLRDEAGTPATGLVEFTSPQIVVAGGSIVVPARITAELDATGNIALTLPATDDPDIQPQSWTWTVTELLTGQPRRRYSLSVPHGSAGIDLSSIAPIPPGPPVYDYLLTSAIGATVAGQGDLDALEVRVVALEQGGSGVQLSDATPAALGTASAGVGTEASRDDHVHPMPTAGDVGAEVAGAVSSHEAAFDPHPQYTTTAEASAVAPVQSVAGRTGYVMLTHTDIGGLGDSATRNVGTVAGTVAAGDDARLSDARTPLAHQHPSTDISDSTATGRAVLTAADVAAARTAIGAGDVVGPESSTDGYMPVFDGTTGKRLKDSGVPLSAIPGRTITGGVTISYRMGTAYGSMDPNVNGSYLFDGRVGYPNKLGANNTKPVDSPTVITRANDTGYISGGASVASILAGYDNVNNALAGVIASQHSMLYYGADHGSIFGGSLHSILGNAFYSSIVGGTNCAIEAKCRYTLIAASTNCKAETGPTDTESGQKSAVLSSDTCVAGGTGNFIVASNNVNIQGAFSTALSGRAITIAGNSSDVIAGGNTVSIGGSASGSYSFVHGLSLTHDAAYSLTQGRDHANSHDMSVLTGIGCKTRFTGTVAHSSRQRGGVAGNNMSLQFSCSHETTDATVKRLSTYGSSGYPVQAQDSVVSGEVFVTGVDTATGECSSYAIRFVSQRVGSGTPTLKSNVTTALYDGLSLGTPPTMNTTSGGIFRVQVVGLASTSIAWHAVFHGQQIVFTP